MRIRQMEMTKKIGGQENSTYTYPIIHKHKGANKQTSCMKPKTYIKKIC